MIKSLPSCVSCSEPGDGAFCAHCGEKRIGAEDRTVRHIVAHAFESATNANGKVWLTLRTLLRRPGQLTADYVRSSAALPLRRCSFSSSRT